MNREGQQGTEFHLDALYQKALMRHAQNPAGTIPVQPVHAEAEGYNPSCGDEIIIRLSQESSGTLKGIQILVHGCSICRASGSILWRLIQELSNQEIQDAIHHFQSLMVGEPADEDLLKEADVLKGVARFPVRLDCALLPWTTLNNALKKLDSL